MQLSVISENKDLYDILTKYSEQNKAVTTASYDSVADYNKSEELNDILIIGRDFPREKISSKDVIVIGEDVKLPYHINSLFLLIEKKMTEYLYDIKGFKFSYKFSALSSEKGEVELTESEAKIIFQMINSYPNKIDKKELLGEVFGYNSEVDTHTLENHIYRLRKKIGEGSDFIETDKSGYRILLK